MSSSEGADRTVAGVAAETPPREARRPARWPWRLGAGALLCLYATTLLAPRSEAPFVVLFGIDSYGWSFLFGLATALLTGSAVGSFVRVLTRDRPVWWADLLSSLTFLLLTLAAVAALPIALLAGALSFKNSYRELGSVDGRDIVVQHFAGWDTDDDLDAGYRNGPFVSFQARGDSYLKRPSADISSWHFSISTTLSTVFVRYRAGQQAHQTGVLTLRRTRL